MVPGHKVTAIFGFCDIRQFTDTTEVLQVCLAVALVTARKPDLEASIR